MDINIKWYKKTFHFKLPSGTSRGVLTEKHAWFIEVFHLNNPAIKGVGECSVIPGLSPDFESFELYEQQLTKLQSDIDISLEDWPSIKFGLESALLDLRNGSKGTYFDNDFTKGEKKIEINGLIWMGSPEFMQQQIDDKIDHGFRTIKMKIGSIDFDQEIELLKGIRKRYNKEQITLRVDANGAFNSANALNNLKTLSELDIHSIEQPIKQGQIQLMSQLCKQTPLPIALDEELIGINKKRDKEQLIESIKPQYIILKPSLHGGISGTKEWIEIAEKNDIEWWITSALESNIGLNAICQLTAEYNNPLPQGLGTGSLYKDNIPSKLKVNSGFIYLDK